jgi:hypothetical protein
MSSLTKLISRVSQEEHADASAAFVALDLSTATSVGETHEHLGGTVDAKLKHDALVHDTDLVLDAHTALESYAELLKEAGDAGIDKKAAAFMRVGLEHFEATLGIKQSLMPSVEAYDGPQGQRMATGVSLEGIKEKTKSLLEMLKKLLKELMAAAGEFIQNYVAGIGKLEAQLNQLKKTADGVTNPDATGEFTLNNPAKLCADGEFLGQDLTLVAGLVSYASKHHGKEVELYMNDLARILNDIDPKSIDIKEVGRKLSYLAEPGAAFGKTDNPVFPGNKVVLSTAIHVNTKLTDKDSIPSGISISTSPNAKQAPETVNVTVRPLGEIKKALGDMLRMCTDLRNSRKRSENVAAASKVLLQAITDLYDRSDDPSEVDGAQWADVHTVCRFATQVANTSFSNFQNVVVYISHTLLAYSKVCERELSMFGNTK